MTVSFAVPDYSAILDSIRSDARYQANLDWGMPRPGHPEGTIRAHIAELEQNLNALRSRLSADEQARLLLFIHVHDTFKPDAAEGAPTSDPTHHAAIAASFLETHVADPELASMVRLHDEPYAIWQRVRSKGTANSERLERLLSESWDWDLYAAVLLIDGRTEGKSREPLRWILDILTNRGLTKRFGRKDAQ